MGTLRYAILGLLNRRSMSGYEMSKEFESTLFEFWNARHSQIYPELKLLTEEGMVTYAVEISGSILEKKIYSITDAGREAFLQWEMERPQLSPVPKDEFRLRLFFSSCLSKEDRLALLEDQLKKHRERLSHLKERLEKFNVLPPEEDGEFSDYLVLSGALSREEGNCQWLEQCIQLCRERGN